MKPLTIFHLPRTGASGLPGPADTKLRGGSLEGHLALPNGARVTFAGRDGAFRVVRSHLHVGAPADAAELHIYLEEDVPESLDDSEL
jgi:hypothetical protein